MTLFSIQPLQDYPVVPDITIIWRINQRILAKRADISFGSSRSARKPEYTNPVKEDGGERKWLAVTGMGGENRVCPMRVHEIRT
jgi:hypothetical protein